MRYARRGRFPATLYPITAGCYDALNRLTNYALGSGVSSCTASGTGIVTKTVAFDSLGNITSKSDVGTYSYPASGSAHPHAVSSITGTVNGVVNPTFTYDLNGTMTAGDGRSVTPTSFNMASAIVQGSTSLCLAYDSDHARITQVQTTATCASPGSGASTTTYLNGAGAMEELFASGATSTWRDYILAEGSIVALRSNTSGTVTMAYFNGDHLGSTSVLTNASGAVTERDSYDAWGRRRNANGTDSTSCSITSATTRGYTGQEMLDPVCAVNLNARLYDPTIGRIMSADSVVPDPFNAQALNRYSYVINNPLAHTDPTGHCWCFYDVTNGLMIHYDAGSGGSSDGTGSSSGGSGGGGGSSYESGGGGETVVITGTRTGSDGSSALGGPVTSVNLGMVNGIEEILNTGKRIRVDTNGGNGFANLPSQNAFLVDQAVLAALGLLNPGQNEKDNVLPYTDNFAKVVNPSAINTKGWKSQFTSHGSAIESPTLPGYPDYAVKMYNDPSLGNTISVVYPTDTLSHLFYFGPYELGYPVNAWIAEDFLSTLRHGH